MSTIQTTSTLSTPTDHKLIDQSALQKLINTALYDPADEFIAQTGKRVRAAIIHESFKAVGGEGDLPEKIPEAIELLHAGSLIVDDIEDDSALRRGKPTLHREIGVARALNIGNWMYFEALERLNAVGLSSQAVHTMLTRCIRTIRRCHEGQALDLGAAVDGLAVEQIYPVAREISRLKTGGLTELCSWMGAISAQATPLQIKAFASFGMGVGVCLQMQNDLQELRQLINGGQRFDDLRNARVTWPWAWAAGMMPRSRLVSLQVRLKDCGDDLDDYRSIAKALLDTVSDHGDALIDARLQREWTLLGEHVVATQGLRRVLERLRGQR